MNLKVKTAHADIRTTNKFYGSLLKTFENSENFMDMLPIDLKNWVDVTYKIEKRRN